MKGQKISPENIPINQGTDSGKKTEGSLGGKDSAGAAEAEPGGNAFLLKIRGQIRKFLGPISGRIKSLIRLPAWVTGFIRKKKKLVILGLISLAICVTAVLSFQLGTRYTNTTLGFPGNKTAAKYKGYPYKLKPFLIAFEVQEPCAFLRFEIDLVAENSRTVAEIKGKELILREAIYTFFLSRDFNSVRMGQKDKGLSAALAQFVNRYLQRGKIRDVLFAYYGFI